MATRQMPYDKRLGPGDYASSSLVNSVGANPGQGKIMTDLGSARPRGMQNEVT